MSELLQKRLVAVFYRGLFMIIALVGVVFNTKIFTADFSPTTLLYYTTQSNLLAFALFTYLFVRTFICIRKTSSLKGPVSFAPNLTFIVMIDIILTFLVFWALLAPTMINTEYDLLSFSNLAVHTITPLAVVGEYFLFNREKKLGKKHVFAVLIYPLIYSSSALIIGAFRLVDYYTFGVGEGATYFPYFFLDFYTHGALIIPYILGIAVFLVALSYGFYFVINKRNRQNT